MLAFIPLVRWAAWKLGSIVFVMVSEVVGIRIGGGWREEFIHRVSRAPGGDGRDLIGLVLGLSERSGGAFGVPCGTLWWGCGDISVACSAERGGLRYVKFLVSLVSLVFPEADRSRIKNISEGGLREIKNTRVERAKRNQSSTCPLGIPSAQPQPEGGDGVRVSLRFRHGQQRDRLFDAVEVGQDGFAAVFF